MKSLKNIALILTTAYMLSGCSKTETDEKQRLERYYVASSDSLPTYVIEHANNEYVYFKDLDRDGFADIKGSAFFAFGEMYRGSKIDTLPKKTYRMDELDKYKEGSHLW